MIRLTQTVAIHCTARLVPAVSSFAVAVPHSEITLRAQLPQEGRREQHWRQRSQSAALPQAQAQRAPKANRQQQGGRERQPEGRARDRERHRSKSAVPFEHGRAARGGWHQEDGRRSASPAAAWHGDHPPGQQVQHTRGHARYHDEDDAGHQQGHLRSLMSRESADTPHFYPGGGPGARLNEDAFVMGGAARF